MRLGTSLLRSPRWPDPLADRGEQRLEYAFVPTSGASIAALEHAWVTYAEEDRVRLFTCENPSVLDRRDVSGRRRERRHRARARVRRRPASRGAALRRPHARRRSPVDAVERPVDGDVAIVEEDLVFELGPFALRSFLVRF